MTTVLLADQMIQEWTLPGNGTPMADLLGIGSWGAALVVYIAGRLWERRARRLTGREPKWRRRVRLVLVTSLIILGVLGSMAFERHQEWFQKEQAALFREWWGVRVVDESQLPGLKPARDAPLKVYNSGPGATETLDCKLTSLGKQEDDDHWYSNMPSRRGNGARQMKFILSCPPTAVTTPPDGRHDSRGGPSS